MFADTSIPHMNVIPSTPKPQARQNLTARQFPALFVSTPTVKAYFTRKRTTHTHSMIRSPTRKITRKRDKSTGTRVRRPRHKISFLIVFYARTNSRLGSALYSTPVLHSNQAASGGRGEGAPPRHGPIGGKYLNVDTRFSYRQLPRRAHGRDTPKVCKRNKPLFPKVLEGSDESEKKS